MALGWFSSASYVYHLNTWPSLYEASWPSSPFCIMQAVVRNGTSSEAVLG